jgi:hypothetical protein
MKHHDVLIGYSLIGEIVDLEMLWYQPPSPLTIGTVAFSYLPLHDRAV